MGKTGYYYYNDTEEKSVFAGGWGGVKAGNPNTKYVWHYRNWLELQFIARTTKERGEILNARQAEKELLICEEKLERTSKRPGFVLEECMLGIQKAKREWERTEVPDRWSHRETEWKVRRA